MRKQRRGREEPPLLLKDQTELKHAHAGATIRLRQGHSEQPGVHKLLPQRPVNGLPGIMKRADMFVRAMFAKQ
jgi:hypothetical protein